MQRIPESIVRVNDIVLGQSSHGFRRFGYPDVDSWEIVSAPGRRRRWRYDGEHTLAVTIASASDLDDLVPSIVAYQIEWNKMHSIIADDALLRDLISRAASGAVLSADEVAEVGARLSLDLASWQTAPISLGSDRLDEPGTDSRPAQAHDAAHDWWYLSRECSRYSPVVGAGGAGAARSAGD